MYYGPEYISHLLAQWAEKHKITLFYCSFSQAILSKMLMLNAITGRLDMTG